jgi:chromosome partition protein MukF
LRDLNQVLLSEAHRLEGLLEDLLELSLGSGAGAAEQAVTEAAEQIERIAAWSSGRQKSWSEYYQYVHRFLRDVVRLDPTRALTLRLRDQLSGKSGKRFALLVAKSSTPLLLRDVVAAPDRPPVKRPRAEREPRLSEVTSDDPFLALEARVRTALSAGVPSLRDVTRTLLLELPEGERFRAAGRVAEIVGRLSRAHAERVRPWVPVDEAFAIEEWSLERAKGQS